MKMSLCSCIAFLFAVGCFIEDSSAQLASPVIVRGTETASFRWQIPTDNFNQIFVISPSGSEVLKANAANQSQLYGDYTTRVTYTGALNVRTMAFDLRDVSRSDNGTYQCGRNVPFEIIDNCGQKLIVLGQPNKPVLNVRSTPVFGRQVTLTCSSTSTTVPADHGLTMTYTWQKDNTDIPVTSPGSTYIFTLNTRDTHSYRCRAREHQGPESVWSNVYNLEPQCPPEIPISVSARADSSSGFVVAWKPGFDGGASQNFTVEYRKGTETDWKPGGTVDEEKAVEYMELNIGNLEASTLYSVRVIARNRFGQSDYTESVMLETEAEIASSNTGVIVGVIAGCLIIVVTVAAVIVLRKGFRCVLLTQDSEVTGRRTNHPVSVPAFPSTSANIQGPTPAQTTYSDLDRLNSERETYTKLKTYMNTEPQSKRDTDTPAQYELMTLHTYENTMTSNTD